MQKGDVYTTYADTTKLKSFAGYKPSVDLKEGIRNFIKWYKDYYKLG
jgi:UDP-glucuronate 4-epimerase